LPRPSSPQPQTAWEWFVAVFYIVWIDIVLAGDNAVVIALAVRSLPPQQRKMGILLGAGAAVVLRASLTAVTTQLLLVPYLKLIGGVLILWIAFKLLRQGDAEEGEGAGATSLWGAVWMILVADVTMSLDNVMAVGGAARGSYTLILFGLALSIPAGRLWQQSHLSTDVALSGDRLRRRRHSRQSGG
jgi:YjbE family integral membrane protein